MSPSRIKKGVALFAALVQCLVSSLAVMPSVALAQANDYDAPEINLVMVDEGVKGETQVFSATITDATAVVSATLHYRLGSDGTFSSVPMSLIQSTDIYTASIDTSQIIVNVVQYYVEARDEGGNRAVQGFAFDPLERVLSDEAVVATAPEAAPVVVPMSRTKKIVYGVLGLLAVGVLVGSTGGSSGNNGNSGATGPNIPLTVTVDPL